MGKVAVAEEFENRERAYEVEQAVGQADVEKLRAAGQEANNGQQHDRQRADRIAGQYAIEHGRPFGGAHDREGEGNYDGGSSSREHQRPPSNCVTRRSMPPRSRSSAPSRVSA